MFSESNNINENEEKYSKILLRPRNAENVFEDGLLKETIEFGLQLMVFTILEEHTHTHFSLIML